MCVGLASSGIEMIAAMLHNVPFQVNAGFLRKDSGLFHVVAHAKILPLRDAGPRSFEGV
jgi:hypothetical protein